MLKKWVMLLGVCACTGLFAAAGQHSSVVALSDAEAIGIRGGGTNVIAPNECGGWFCSAETCNHLNRGASGAGQYASATGGSHPCGGA